jgi:RHS repeat-associated protein
MQIAKMRSSRLYTLFALGFLVCGCLLTAQPALGQSDVSGFVGVPPFSTWSQGQIDGVNLGNLDVHLSIPLVHKAGRGMDFNLALNYDSTIWESKTGGTIANPTYTWTPYSSSYYGWSGMNSGSVFGYILFKSPHDTVGRCTGTYTVYDDFVYVDPSGASHPVDGILVYPAVNNCASTSGTYQVKDGSGYTINLAAGPGGLSGSVTDRSGDTIQPPVVLGTSVSVAALPGGAASIADSNGNNIATTDGTTYTDTLGMTVLTKTSTTAGGQPVSDVYAYTGPNGTPEQVAVSYSVIPVATAFGCDVIEANLGGANAPALITSIALPDGSSYGFKYEPTPGMTGYVTGRLAEIDLPTGGKIQYAYDGEHDGLQCWDGSTSGLTRTTSDGVWTYSRNSAGSQTTVTDPGGNQTVYTFIDGFETQSLTYQGQAGSNVLLQSTVTCYNGNFDNGTAFTCATGGLTGATGFTDPITQQDIYTTLPGGKTSLQETVYNTYGLPVSVAQYDYGQTPGVAPSVYPLHTIVTAYDGTSPSIHDRPSCVGVANGLASSCSDADIQLTQYYNYDMHGNVGSITKSVGANASLTTSYTYYSTGLVNTATDVNGTQTTYSYGDCNNSYLTSTTTNTSSGSLTTSETWDCGAGVVTSATDANGKSTSYSYKNPTDPFGRPTSVTDPLGNTTYYSYSPTTMEAALTFNGGNSAVDTLSTVDGLGRMSLSQRRQAPGFFSFDSVQYAYGWQTSGNTAGAFSRQYLPYQGSPGAYTTTQKDALGRTVGVVDAGGGSAAYGYAQNDVMQALEPAPAGENAKQRQMEYDGLGRLTSVCEVTKASGSGTCGQSSPQQGYSTRYAYAGTTMTVTQNAQSSAPQTRSYTYDMVGRLISESNPETGTISYVYDSDATCGSYPGDLVKRVDNSGSFTCYSYDNLHRLTRVVFLAMSPSLAPPYKCFVYDAAIAVPGLGKTTANVNGRLAEAYTSSVDCLNMSKLTDLLFSYDADGNVVEVFESTPNSGGYYDVAVQYWANGALESLSGVGLPSLTFGADGEGRINSVKASSGQNPVSNVSYNAAGQATGVTYGSGDSDSFVYDPNTGRLLQYAYYVGATCQPVVGTMNWNANGSLGSLGTLNPFNSSGTDFCSYGYDDLSRITNASCVGGWGQGFTYDAFGNITKGELFETSTGATFQPTGYNSANQPLGVGMSFDGNGNLTGELGRSYTWYADGTVATIGNISLTYDAMGRQVEQGSGGNYTQTVYGPGGQKLALMNGQTLQKAFVPLPGGATAVYTSVPVSGETTEVELSYYRHPDWLGSSRFASTPTQTMYSSTSYGPFGEAYNGEGATDLSFTGMNADTVPDLYDFMYRKYSPVQSRWISPDPSGLQAVDTTNPQSWNRYAYVLNNPLRSVDADGLDGEMKTDDSGGGDSTYSDNYLLFLDAYTQFMLSTRGAPQSQDSLDDSSTGCDPGTDASVTDNSDDDSSMGANDLNGTGGIGPGDGIVNAHAGGGFLRFGRAGGGFVPYYSHGGGGSFRIRRQAAGQPGQSTQQSQSSQSGQSGQSGQSCKSPTKQQQDQQILDECEAEAKAAAGPLVTGQSAKTAILSGGITLLLPGGTVLKVLRGAGVGLVSSAAVKGIDYVSTYYACLQTHGIPAVIPHGP